jgi:uncharacterized membrane protein YfcA
MGMASLSIIVNGFPISRKKTISFSFFASLSLVISLFLFQSLSNSVNLKFLFSLVLLIYAVYLIFNKPLQPSKAHKGFFLIFALLAGIISSLLGTGADIILFMALTLFYSEDHKTATNSSIIAMTIISIIGSLFQFFYFKNVSVDALDYWLVSIPVVIFFAPLGTMLCNKISQKSITRFLIFIIILDFLSTVFTLFLPIELT